MAKREDKPMQNRVRAAAAIVSMTVISAAPVLAAPDRNLCDDANEATLDVASAELSRTPVAKSDEPIELLGPNFELAVQERVVEEDLEREQEERNREKSADEVDRNEATIPAESGGPLVNKRQMYRRDI